MFVIRQIPWDSWSLLADRPCPGTPISCTLRAGCLKPIFFSTFPPERPFCSASLYRRGDHARADQAAYAEPEIYIRHPVSLMGSFARQVGRFDNRFPAIDLADEQALGVLRCPAAKSVAHL